MSLPNLLRDIAEKYLDGRQDAFWQHKQSGQWLIKHRDLEIAAGRAKITFEQPVILEAKAGESVAMIVTGTLGEMKEWSIGEASPKNTQQAYPYAMAEKRAKDRVILKLFGIHGHAYSEEEADDFKQPQRQKQIQKREPNDMEFEAYKMGLEQATNLEELKGVWVQIVKNGHDNDTLTDIKEIRKQELSQ